MAVLKTVLVATLTVLTLVAPPASASPSRLKITKGGTPDKPLTYSGDGQRVGGIDIEADYIIVDGYKPSAPGIEIHGNNVTVQNNTVTSPKGGDGLRFFGNNTISKTDRMYLMGEGPNSEVGDGSGKGVSQDWTFSNNYCQTKEASQTLMIDDVQHLTVTGVTGPDHAIGLQNHSTDAHVKNNKLDPSIPCEVGIDKSSKKGYVGPEPRCQP